MIPSPIADTAADLRAGRRTVEGLVSDCIARIAKQNDRLNAFVHVEADAALAQAQAADRDLANGIDRGPLHGIPIGIKDMIDVAGMPCQHGSRRSLGHLPHVDADCVRRLRDAGAIIVGKLATYEFATVGPSFDTPFPPAINPWNPDHITGGSSSGSASAVAGGLLRAAIGTDTGGSVRSPASYCGIVGLKPTRGRVSKAGAMPLSVSLDHIGPLAASVEDAAFVLDAIGQAGPWTAAGGRIGQPIDGMVLGYARSFFASDPLVSPQVVAALDDAASRLSMIGAEIREIDLPDYAHFEAAAAVILQAEAFALHRSGLASDRAGYGTKTFRTLASGVAIEPTDIDLARRVGAHLTAQLDNEIFSQCAAFITVTTLAPAPPVSAFRGDAAEWTPMRTMGFNLTGHPALSLPCGFADGLPIGMQIVGPYDGEADICRIGTAFEAHTDFSAPIPPFAA